MAPLAEGETMLTSQGPIGLWSKEVHFVGNTVPFGMLPIRCVSRDDVTSHRRTCLPPITRFTSPFAECIIMYHCVYVGQVISNMSHNPFQVRWKPLWVITFADSF
jgi:hypothetical protein